MESNYMLEKGEKLFRIIRSFHFSDVLLRFRVAAGVEHDGVLKGLQNYCFKTVVDIGANRGQFALIARKYFPDANIISFEPLREPADIFSRVFKHDPLVFLHEIAIGPEEKDMPIHISRADDSSSILPISSLQNSLFPGTEEKEVRMIQVKPLGSVLRAEDIKKPAFLKLDVQGYEREALEGCKPLLASFSFVYVECSFVELYTGQPLAHEVISFLYELGFILSGVYNLCYDKKDSPIQGDFLFKRKAI